MVTAAAQDRRARRARAPDGHTLGLFGLRGFAFKSGFKIFLVSQIRLKAESASHIPFFYCYKTPRSSLQPCPSCTKHERRSRVLGRSTSVSWRGLPDCKRRCISHQVQFCNAVSCLHRFAKLEASNTPLSVAAAVVVRQSLQQRDRRSEPRSSSAPKSRLQRRPRLAPPSNSPSAAPSVRFAR